MVEEIWCLLPLWPLIKSLGGGNGFGLKVLRCSRNLSHVQKQQKLEFEGIEVQRQKQLKLEGLEVRRL